MSEYVGQIDLANLLQGQDLEGKEGVVPVENLLSRKLIALYFSAHWCGPCRQFTPNLVEFYKQILSYGADWEVVFVSSDRDQKSFSEYYKEMPWVAIPFGDQRINSLKKAAQISGIPTLIFVEPTSGKVIIDELENRDGRDIVDANDYNFVLDWALSS